MCWSCAPTAPFTVVMVSGTGQGRVQEPPGAPSLRHTLNQRITKEPAAIQAGWGPDEDGGSCRLPSPNPAQAPPVPGVRCGSRKAVGQSGLGGLRLQQEGQVAPSFSSLRGWGRQPPTASRGTGAVCVGAHPAGAVSQDTGRGWSILEPAGSPPQPRPPTGQLYWGAPCHLVPATLRNKIVYYLCSRAGSEQGAWQGGGGRGGVRCHQEKTGEGAHCSLGAARRVGGSLRRGSCGVTACPAAVSPAPAAPRTCRCPGPAAPAPQRRQSGPHGPCRSRRGVSGT